MVALSDRLEAERNEARRQLAATAPTCTRPKNERDAERHLRLQSAHTRPGKGSAVLDLFRQAHAGTHASCLRSGMRRARGPATARQA